MNHNGFRGCLPLISHTFVSVKAVESCSNPQNFMVSSQKISLQVVGQSSKSRDRIPWIPHRFPIHFSWISHRISHVFPYFPSFLRVSPSIFHGFPMEFPMFFHRFPTSHRWFPSKNRHGQGTAPAASADSAHAAAGAARHGAWRWLVPGSLAAEGILWICPMEIVLWYIGHILIL